jgi:hypothetical protein
VAIGLLLPIPDDCAVGETPTLVVGAGVPGRLAAGFEALRGYRAVANPVELKVSDILLKRAQCVGYGQIAKAVVFGC